MTLGKRLKAAREKRNWSQKMAAEKVGITNTVLSNYERDFRDPDTETLRKLADLYEVNVDYLLGRPTDKVSSVLVDKDERDIAKRMEKIREDLTKEDGLTFLGEPMSEEAIESFLESMEHIVRQTQRINKKYIPKKYRENDDN